MSPQSKTLGDAAQFINGFAFGPEHWGTSGLPIIRIQNLTGPGKPFDRTTAHVHDRYRVRPGELLVSWSATLGVFEWNRDECGLVNQHIFRVVPNEAVSFKGYLKYAISRTIQSMERFSHGSTMRHINRAEFLATKVWLPSLGEQRRIAAILDKADTIRRKREQAIQLADEFLRSLFLDMFGDPIRNSKGWRRSTFGDQLVLLQYGPRFYNEPYSETGIRTVRITDLDAAGSLSFERMPRIQATERTIQSFSLRPGDLIFARSGATVGKAAVIEESHPPCIAGAYFLRMRFSPTVMPHYVRRVLASNSVQNIIAEQSRQSAQQNFSGPAVRRLPLPIPPRSLQERFVQVENVVRSGLRQMGVHLNSAKSLSSALANRAFRGEL